MINVRIVMGSKSDLRIMAAAKDKLDEFGVSVDVQILSAHRTPHLLEKEALRWKKMGTKVVIAGAGGAAHLPGMLASFSEVPVIGVPIGLKPMNGLDSLFSIAQMPKGVPVATVAINGAENAALLAIQILSLSDTRLAALFVKYKNRMRTNIMADRKKIASKNGIKRLLSGN